jgi:hypothetical protein
MEEWSVRNSNISAVGAEVSKSVSGGKSALSTQAGLQSKEKESGGLYFFIENRTLLFYFNRTVLHSLEGGSPSPDQRPSS